MKKSTMEIFFDKLFLFPYKYIGFLDSEQWEPFSDFAIYCVLSRDKLEVTDCCFKHGVLSIKFLNVLSNKSEKIADIDIFGINMPDEYVSVNIINAGAAIKIDINQYGKKHLIENGVNLFDKSCDTYTIKITIYQLLYMLEEKEGTIENLSLLYIGQSKHTEKRLANHKKIQEIIRDKDLNSPGKEIMVLLCHPVAKYYSRTNFDSLNLNVVMGNTLQNDQQINNIGRKEILDVAEAMLIQFFNPPYNDVFKKTVPNKKQRTYSVMESNNINEIKLVFQLYLDNNITLNISTDSSKTKKQKILILSCTTENLSQEKSGCIKTEKISSGIFV